MAVGSKKKLINESSTKSALSDSSDDVACDCSSCAAKENVSVLESTVSHSPEVVVGGGSMTNRMFDELCSLNDKLTRAACDATNLRAETAMLKKDNMRLLADNTRLTKEVSELQGQLTKLLAEHQGRLWNLERESHANAVNLQTISDRVK